jgi:hypothetical protein
LTALLKKVEEAYQVPTSVWTLRERLVSNLPISLYNLSYSKNNFKHYLFNISGPSSSTSSVSSSCQGCTSDLATLKPQLIKKYHLCSMITKPPKEKSAQIINVV